MSDLEIDGVTKFDSKETTRNVWVFDTTGGGYDATQVRDEIEDGDILLVPSENVAGYLHQAWPMAVTEDRGEFHGYVDGVVADDMRVSHDTAVDVWKEYQAANSR
ncbi:hypothetical protein CPI83_29780 (plasmid) [Rhodococcus sp. H-CA8f]|uniref:hypothetical protein n=1 Tax=Rhodococcus sp. H-CA8f TaxID=1727214 RepID=UPI000BE22D15|nr:hypothetical protein [Rhodococcus sp. H-CA8f]ATI36391.1 hypothetical protein CPI83_29780 [Rhodococcus sp. H-CA8f]